jgi:hypothetical protein
MARLEARRVALSRSASPSATKLQSRRLSARTSRRFLSPGPYFRVLGIYPAGFRPPSPAPVQPSKRQSPVVGPDDYPGPPECAGIRPPHARRRRIPPHSKTPHEAPPRERDEFGLYSYRNTVNRSRIIYLRETMPPSCPARGAALLCRSADAGPILTARWTPDQQRTTLPNDASHRQEQRVAQYPGNETEQAQPG